MEVFRYMENVAPNNMQAVSNFNAKNISTSMLKYQI